MSKKASKNEVAPQGGDKQETANLTTKQQRFVDAYLGEARFNATEAARLAGYEGNDVTLAAVGYENLRKPQIASAIDTRLKELQMSSDEVLTELADIARAEWREFVEVKQRDGEIIEANLKLSDKLKALELVGKYHKLFTDRTEHTGKDGGPIRIVKAEDLSDDELARIAGNK